MSSTLAYILGIIVLIVGVAVSVALHELGHMIPAKRFGVKVPEYFIGFGPRVWSMKRGETEYGVKAIWLGGYVKLLGMLPPAPPGRVDKPGSMVADARQESLAELGPDEQDRAFYRLSVPRKLLVMAGGILTNLALGIVCLVLALGVVGQYTHTSTISSVSACVPAELASSSASGPECADTDPVSPAVTAGVVRRDGAETTLRVTPVEVERSVTASDGTTSTESAPYVGIGPAKGTVRVPLSQIPGAVAVAVGQTLKAIFTLPVGLYHSVAAGLGLEQRNPGGLVSLVGVGRIAGEVSSEGVGVPFSARVSSMLSLLGSLNLALFAFNLVPLLPLDGGHVAGACWEGLRRAWARWRGRPDPGPVDTARMLPVGQGVFVALVIMALVLIWVDIVAPF